MSNVALGSSPPSAGSSPPPAMPTFRSDVEGMRAVAVALVLAYHAFAHPFTGGCVGVDVFFVISGFLITGLLLRESSRSGRISIAAFYARRVRRVLPAATAVVLATTVTAYVLLGFVTGNAVAAAATWTAVFAANVYFGLLGNDYLGSQLPPSPLDHMWSLGVEEQFYVVWPLVLLAAVLALPGRWRRPGLAAILGVVIAASLAWSVIGTHTNATWAYLSPFTRAWELALGALVAVAAPSLARIRDDRILQTVAGLGIVAIAASSLLLDARTPYPGSAVVVPVLGTALLIGAGCANPRTVVGRALGAAPMQWIGARSYSLYVWHWPVLAVAAQYAGHALTKTQNAGLLAVAAVLAALSYSLLENPVRHSSFLVARDGITLAVGAALIAVTVVVAQVLIATHQSSSASAAARPSDHTFATGAEVQAAVAAAQTVTDLPAEVAARLTAPDPPSPGRGFDCSRVDDTGATSFGQCAYGDPAGDRVVVAYGDARAMTWSTPLARLAAENGWQLRVFALDGCPPADLHLQSQQSGTPNAACDRFHRAAVAAITALAPRLVVTTGMVGPPLADGSDVTPSQWADGLASTYAALAPTGARFAAIGDLPTWDDDDAHCLARRPQQVQACSAATDDAAPDDAFVDAERSAVTAHGGVYVTPTPWVCAHRCEPVIAGKRVYANEFDLTSDYADYLTGALGEALAPVRP
ncbi:acyltransferase family protein [Mycobacterium yunnanensis]|uniref:acyltransferase family protein n=1 Tax=Mycobacterium yunnanensis TaxID=368477 RepID=UPI0021F2C448|nr:acyltransferase family protein [Mycobacterium yunnanensis]